MQLPGHADSAAADAGMWQKAPVLSSTKAAQLYVHFNSLRGKAAPPARGILAFQLHRKPEAL